MSGSVIIGGAYFTDTRINLIQGPIGAETITVPWQDVDSGVYPEVGDWVFVLGIKKWVRRLKKTRCTYPQIADKIASYISHLVGKRPYGILDDCNWDDEEGIGERLRSRLSPVVWLLREYVKGCWYPEGTHPFSIPCADLGRYKTSSQIPISFYGNASHKERKKWISRIERVAPEGSVLTLYHGGEKSSSKLSRDEYFSIIGQSKVGLSFRGAGYCCFRYQEIPAVGSCLAVPKSKHVVRNDYSHGKHCIKFDTVQDVLDNLDRADDLAAAGHEHFLKYHTTEVRRNELREYMDEVRRN